jgi:hypothetical protein
MSDFNLDKLECFGILFDETFSPMEQRMFLVFMFTRAVQLIGPAEVQEMLDKIIEEGPYCDGNCDHGEEEEAVIEDDEENPFEMTTDEFKAKLRKILKLDPPDESDDDDWSEVIH